jgi:hypothetical protein
MLLIVTLAGMLGSVVLGLRGLAAGSAGELDRILALGCLFAAAAGFLGAWLDDGRRAKKTPLITRDEWVHLIVSSPIVLLMIGVLLVTLIPSIYVMLPVFAVWHFTSRAHPEPPASRTPEPAYAHSH